MRIDLKWPVVIIALLLTLAMVYTLNYWRHQHLIKEPLKEALLEIEEVECVDISNNKNNIEVLVTLNQTEDLSQTYGEIEEIMLSTYAENSFKVILVDNRNTYLESLYEEIHFAVMEGERLGNYTQMKKEISCLLEQEKKLDSYLLRVDQKRIYLQLASKDGFLYEVIPLISRTEVGHA
ncbi:MAG: hypothetical protein GX996_05285 [Firmicutes bacterium]|nr:hypothetical protein [Bacillota bacterium]